MIAMQNKAKTTTNIQNVIKPPSRMMKNAVPEVKTQNQTPTKPKQK